MFDVSIQSLDREEFQLFKVLSASFRVKISKIFCKISPTPRVYNYMLSYDDVMA